MGDKLNILIVDDEDIIRELLADYFREVGHDVEEASDGIEALQMIKERSYNIALVDIRMPGMDGLALLEAVGPLRPDLPVVIITGHGDMESESRARRLGAADFLTKPVAIEDLDRVLEKVSGSESMGDDKLNP